MLKPALPPGLLILWFPHISFSVSHVTSHSQSATSHLILSQPCHISFSVSHVTSHSQSATSHLILSQPRHISFSVSHVTSHSQSATSHLIISQPRHISFSVSHVTSHSQSATSHLILSQPRHISFSVSHVHLPASTIHCLAGVPSDNLHSVYPAMFHQPVFYSLFPAPLSHLTLSPSCSQSIAKSHALNYAVRFRA